MIVSKSDFIERSWKNFEKFLRLLALGVRTLLGPEVWTLERRSGPPLRGCLGKIFRVRTLWEGSDRPREPRYDPFGVRTLEEGPNLGGFIQVGWGQFRIKPIDPTLGF